MSHRLSTEEIALTLLMTPGIGSRTVSRFLLWCAGRNVHPGDWTGLERRVLGAELPEGLGALLSPLADLTEESAERALRLGARVREAGANLLTILDPDYPDALRIGLGSDAPPLLSVAGDLDLVRGTGGAVVGTRQPSDEGLAIAAACAEWVGRRGGCVVSGGAAGIDTCAHAAAIRDGGRTLVVLPQGLLTFRVAGPMREAIDDGRAALVGQFVPDAAWSTGGAIERNLTIVALSRLVCVIEPQDRGGSARTARNAIDQATPLFVHWPRTAGPKGSRHPEFARARAVVTAEQRLNENELEKAWRCEARIGQQHLF